MSKYEEAIESIKACYEQQFGGKMADKDADSIYGASGEKETTARKAIRSAVTKQPDNPIAYIIAILKKDKKQDAIGSQRDITFGYIHDPMLETGVLTQEEYELIRGTWHGRELPEERKGEINFKKMKYLEPNNPATWFPTFGYFEKKVAIQMAEKLLEDKINPTWEYFTAVKSVASKLRQEASKSLPVVKPLSQIAEEVFSHGR